jgi:hypothetical protein
MVPNQAAALVVKINFEVFIYLTTLSITQILVYNGGMC